MPTRMPPLAAVLLGTFAAVFAVTSLSAVFRIDNPIPAANAEFGTGIAGLGDQNGDGIPDFAVGVPGVDRVDVFSGRDRTRFDRCRSRRADRTPVRVCGCRGRRCQWRWRRGHRGRRAGSVRFRAASLRPDGACMRSAGVGSCLRVQRRHGRADPQDRPHLGALRVRLLAGRSRRREWRWRIRSRGRRARVSEQSVGRGLHVFGRDRRTTMGVPRTSLPGQAGDRVPRPVRGTGGRPQTATDVATCSWLRRSMTTPAQGRSWAARSSCSPARAAQSSARIRPRPPSTTVSSEAP